MQNITRVIMTAAIAATVSACALEAEPPEGEFSQEPATGSDEAAVEMQSARHCVSEAVPAGSKAAGASPVCFATFAEAISYATDGTLQVPPEASTITQEQLDTAHRDALSAGLVLATVVIGISYWDASSQGSSWTHTATSGCDTDSGIEWQIGGNFGGWNDQISSARAFNRCQGVYFEHASFGGARIGTPWSGGAMNDRASSVRWR